MFRVSFLVAFILVLGGVASTAAEAEGARPKRVLFRSDSPRLFAPRDKAKPTPEPAKVRSSQVATPTPRPLLAAARPPEPSPRQPVPPPAKPRLTERKTLATRLIAPPQTGRGFEIDFLPTSYTPYDRFMGPVKAVIASLDRREADMVTACDLVRQGRSFRYRLTDLYRADPPAVTAARRAGDCKSKALWVYDQLGDPQAYYVIGKLVQRSRTSHAWVYWRNNGRWWILDPTVRSAPIAADSVASGRYVPYYSYSRAGAFRHRATRLMVAARGLSASPTLSSHGAAATR